MNRQHLLDKFFGDIGLEELNPQEKEKIFEKVLNNMENRILLRIRSIMSDEEVKEWESLKTDEELDSFYKEKKIDIAGISEEEAKLSREQLVQIVAYIRGKMDK